MNIWCIALANCFEGENSNNARVDAGHEEWRSARLFENDADRYVCSLISSSRLLINVLVVPLSVLSNWEQQIQDHCTPGTIKYIVYHGSNRSFNSEELAKYDIVITTYQTVSGEHTRDLMNGQSGSSKKRKKSERTLFGVQWKVKVMHAWSQLYWHWKLRRESS